MFWLYFIRYSRKNTNKSARKQPIFVKNGKIVAALAKYDSIILIVRTVGLETFLQDSYNIL